MRVIDVNLTDNTTIYNVVDNNRTIASFGKDKAAEDFIQIIKTHSIETLSDWRQLPMKIRVLFISASCMVEPNLPR